MNLAKALGIGFSGVVVTGGAGLFTANELTSKETFSDALLKGKDKKVISTAKSEKGSKAWEVLSKRIEGTTSYQWYSQEFLSLKSAKNDSDREEKLIKLCQDVSSRRMQTLFRKKDPKLNYTYETFCSSTFGNILFEKGFGSIGSPEMRTDETEKIKEKLSSLKNHTDSEKEGEINKEPELKALKEKISSDKEPDLHSSENQVALMKWCHDKEKNYYSNREDNAWKLVEKFCFKH